MNYTFSPLTQRQAEQIAYEWQYNGPFAFYDMPNDEDDLAEFLNPEERTEHYFAVLNKEELIGYYVFEPNAEVVDVGLGMRPDLTGQGNGTAFFRSRSCVCNGPVRTKTNRISRRDIQRAGDSLVHEKWLSSSRTISTDDERRKL